MADTHTVNELDKLKELLEGIRYTMFTTRADGIYRARPMTTLEADTSGVIWFFSDRQSPLVAEIRNDPQVGLAYSDEGKARYVSVSGTVALRDDPAKVEELWNPILNAWFDGKDDPNLQLLEVTVDAAEYWDVQGNRLVRFAGIVAAAVTGDTYDAGEHGEIKPAAGTTAR